MKVLFLSGWYPWPADNGARIRILNLLRALAAEHEVTLIAARDPSARTWRDEPVLEAICRRIKAVPWSPRVPHGIRRLLSFARSVPEWVVVQPSPEMDKAISEEVQAAQYDLIVAYELTTAIYTHCIRRVPVLLEALELGGFRSRLLADRTLLRRWRGRVFWWKLRRALGRLFERLDGCTVVSEAERQLLAGLMPNFGPVEVIPNCIDYASYEGLGAQPQQNTLVFVGSLDFDANYEAVTYFLQRIFPLVRARVPDAQLRITGRHSRTDLPPEFQTPGVMLTGYVDDVRTLIANSWVNVVPLLTGGGTRFKILEAMALGTAVVSTRKGAEGLEVADGTHLLLADSPEDFAVAVARLCHDVGLRSRLAAEARGLVAGSHDWSRVAPRFLNFADRVASKGAV